MIYPIPSNIYYMANANIRIYGYTIYVEGIDRNTHMYFKIYIDIYVDIHIYIRVKPDNSVSRL